MASSNEGIGVLTALTYEPPAAEEVFEASIVDVPAVVTPIYDRAVAEPEKPAPAPRAAATKKEA